MGRGLRQVREKGRRGIWEDLRGGSGGEGGGREYTCMLDGRIFGGSFWCLEPDEESSIDA